MRSLTDSVTVVTNRGILRETALKGLRLDPQIRTQLVSTPILVSNYARDVDVTAIWPIAVTKNSTSMAMRFPTMAFESIQQQTQMRLRTNYYDHRYQTAESSCSGKLHQRVGKRRGGLALAISRKAATDSKMVMSLLVCMGSAVSC